MKTLRFILIGAAIMAVASCGKSAQQQAELAPITKKALYDSTSRFYGRFQEYPTEMSQLPIGVFDSGTGGLTVLEKLLSLDKYDNITGEGSSDKILDFAGEHFIYLGDQANMPYGRYPSDGSAEYLKELAVKDALFLLDDKYYMNAFESEPSGVKPRVKIIVIACNTATAYGLEEIQRMVELSGTGVKVIGVINAGVKATFDELHKNGADGSPLAIGVLATPGTISSGAYERTIKAAAEAGKVPGAVTVVNQSGYGFAEAVDQDHDFVNPSLTEPRDSYKGPRIGTEDDCIDTTKLALYNFNFEGNGMLFTKAEDGSYTELQLNSAENYARFNLVSLMERFRAAGTDVPLKAVILGCTHYPFLLETLEKVVAELRDYKECGVKPYRDIIAEDMVFIDPALYTAMECYSTLRKDNNLSLSTGRQQVNGYISVPSLTLTDACLTPDGNLTFDFKYGRQAGTEEITTKQVPFSRTNFNSENLSRVEALLPYCYSLIYPTMH